MADKFVLGLDFGTNSVRALIAGTDGEEYGTGVFDYQNGQMGILTDPANPLTARQHPADYLDGLVQSVKSAIDGASSKDGFSPQDIIGIGVDTTGSTPIPVDENCFPLGLKPEFSDNLSAMAWLWKDHTGHSEAEEITALAEEIRPQYLKKCGGTYSSEWFWAKVLHCARTAPEVYNAAHTWLEHADWIPALLCSITDQTQIKRSICAAGHKAMFHPEWNGYPDSEFLEKLDPALVKLRSTLPDTAYAVGETVGTLCDEWSGKLGISEGLPVSVGAFDAHLGAVGSGIKNGTLVKIIGTSTCDILVADLNEKLPDIPGLCGIVPESVLPGCYGLEAGQSAVGDIFNWYVNSVKPGNMDHAQLTEEAECLRPGESGLLALDWHNGNRTVLVDQRLTGMIMGMTLHTSAAEIFRTLIEATAFGARTIIERFEEYNVDVQRIICCGGIPTKNSMLMQIYADVTGKTMLIAKSTQACALGAAMSGAVAAGAENGGFDNFSDACDSMCGMLPQQYSPIPENRAVYERLYTLYKKLHDIFGTKEYVENQYDVMKELMKIRDEARK